jgi:hypothetical protein
VQVDDNGFLHLQTLGVLQLLLLPPLFVGEESGMKHSCMDEIRKESLPRWQTNYSQMNHMLARRWKTVNFGFEKDVATKTYFALTPKRLQIQAEKSMENSSKAVVTNMDEE